MTNTKWPDQKFAPCYKTTDELYDIPATSNTIFLFLFVILAPAEILARGPEVEVAFRKALAEGEKLVFKTRLMLVGQERVGKSSLMKNITGQG